MTTFPEAADLQRRVMQMWAISQSAKDTLQEVVNLLEIVKRIDFYTTQPEQPEHPELPLT